MEKDVFDIIKEKEFLQLSDSERKEVLENCETEDQFYQMKHVLNQASSLKMDSYNAKPDTKVSLDKIFADQHKAGKRLWYMSIAAVVVPAKPIQKQPLLYAAALIIALFLIIPMNDTSLVTESNTLAQLDKQEAPVESLEASLSDSDDSKVEASDEEVLTRTVQEPAIVSNGSGIEGVTSNATGAATSFTWTASPNPGSTGTKGLGFDHPDGVYEEWETEENLCIAASSQPEVLDLLTATF